MIVCLFLLAGSPRVLQASDLLIVGYGDSLMAGYGLAPGKSFPAQLERYLRETKGIDATVVNAGVSGDTSSGGLARLDWVLSGLEGRTPDLVIVELGANDALRGISPALTRKNLDDLIQKLKARDIPVLLAGMLAPPNMGVGYSADFNSLYPELAKKHDIPLYPFFLDGVALQPSLNQDDGMHPTDEGIAVIVDNIAPYVTRALRNSAS